MYIQIIFLLENLIFYINIYIFFFREAGTIIRIVISYIRMKYNTIDYHILLNIWGRENIFFNNILL